MQNYHELILSNLISDSEFSNNSKFYGRDSKKQKADNREASIMAKTENGEKILSLQLQYIHMGRINQERKNFKNNFGNIFKRFFENFQKNQKIKIFKKKI